MSEKTTIWRSALICRFAMSQVRQGWVCCFLFVALCTPLALTSGDDQLIEETAGSQALGASLRNDHAGQPSELPVQIAELIALLDSQDFAQREQASIDLAALGEPVIGPLAYQSFHCSPEAGWRIKKTLENICTSGTESVFFKAIAILNLRFNVGGSDRPALAQSLARLESEWRKKRKTEAIIKLRAAGATVNDPFENIDVEFQQMPVWRGANLLAINNDVVVNASRSSRSNTNSRNAVKQKLTEKQLKEKIKMILDSSLDENRDLVFGSQANSVDPDRDDPAVAPNIAAQIAIQNQIRANQLLVGRQPGFSGSGVTIEFGENWNNQAADLKLLDDVDNLQQLGFVRQSISGDELNKFANVPTLTNLVFDDCDFDANGFEDADWKVLQELELRNQTITSELIESCASIASLRSITFSACKLDRGSLNALSKSRNLRILQFDETDIDDTVFEMLADLEQVNYVNLTVCKFQTDDYNKLKAARPNLQIAFTAQAFLGVRGPVNMGLEAGIRFDQDGNRVDRNPDQQSGVLVTDVIDDSGAQKAGVKIGDVIESVDGMAIEKFEDLRLHIAQRRAGDKLEVTVRRGDELVELQVELGSQKNAPRF